MHGIKATRYYLPKKGHGSSEDIEWKQNRKSNPKEGGQNMAARKKKKRTAKQLKAIRMRNLRKAWAKNRTKAKRKTTKKRKTLKRRKTKKRVVRKLKKRRVVRKTKRRLVRKTAKRKGPMKAHKGERKGQHVKRKKRWYVVSAGRVLRKSTAAAANRAKKRK